MSEHEHHDGTFPPPDLRSPQLTLRSLGTGVLLGAVLAPCNIYAGLKIGWMFNMSIAAALISFGFWQGMHRATRGRTAPLGLLENNINQTAASAGASIASAGLVAPIPALTMLTGEPLSWPVLVVWLISVSLLGIVVGVGLRRQMLLVDRLPFPAGIATAATVKEIYGRGREAMARVKVLLVSAAAAGAITFFDSFIHKLPKLTLPISLALPAKAFGGIKSVTLRNLGFVLDPSLLMIGFGAIIGMRAGLSLLFGAIVAWGIIGPWGLSGGWIQPGTTGADGLWYGAMVDWMVWPGVTMMVTASLASFALSWRSIVSAFVPRGRRSLATGASDHDVPRRWFLVALVAVLCLCVATQNAFFGIAIGTAVFAVLLTFALAIVAARVSGETGITPIGAMGQVTQLTFASIAPGNVTANLMSANVTGGAAGQSADLLHDMKTGLLIGASPRFQAIAQVFGVLSGALVGTAAYLLLVPDPASMLLTDEWPAPAVAQWKAVAEVLVEGFAAMPPYSVLGLVIAGVVGIVLAVLEKVLPPNRAQWVPSPSALGLAFVIPAWNSMSMFFGAGLAYLLTRHLPRWSHKYLMVLAAGLVAGESLAGVGGALPSMLGR